MKSLKQFIKEEYEANKVENLKLVFNVKPEEFYLNAPETYSESDIQVYIGDVLLKELPADNDKYSKLLGKNVENINDAYFEYDKFEHMQDSDIDEFNLEWDQYYDEKHNEDKLDVYKITNLRYVIMFDEFEILDDSDDIRKTLDEVFHKLDSSNINKYPVEIEYDSKQLEYSE
ncbi:MAG: hypothetical protein IJH39_08310 [Clostridia bacterium]|nr:hypothetical protein [Clostridia bacterium]